MRSQGFDLCHEQDDLRTCIAERRSRPGRLIQGPTINFKNPTASSKKEVYQSSPDSLDWAIIFVGEKTVPPKYGSKIQEALVFRGLQLNNSPYEMVSCESKLDADLANVSSKLAPKGAPSFILVILSTASNAKYEKLYSKVKLLGDVKLGKFPNPVMPK